MTDFRGNDDFIVFEIFVQTCGGGNGRGNEEGKRKAIGGRDEEKMDGWMDARRRWEKGPGDDYGKMKMEGIEGMEGNAGDGKNDDPSEKASVMSKKRDEKEKKEERYPQKKRMIQT